MPLEYQKERNTLSHRIRYNFDCFILAYQRIHKSCCNYSIISVGSNIKVFCEA